MGMLQNWRELCLKELENFTGELLKKVKQPIRQYNAGAAACYPAYFGSTHKCDERSRFRRGWKKNQ
jgi:hypothetical protein